MSTSTPYHQDLMLHKSKKSLFLWHDVVSNNAPLPSSHALLDEQTCVITGDDILELSWHYLQQSTVIACRVCGIPTIDLHCDVCYRGGNILDTPVPITIKTHKAFILQLRCFARNRSGACFIRFSGMGSVLWIFLGSNVVFMHFSAPNGSSIQHASAMVSIVGTKKFLVALHVIPGISFRHHHACFDVPSILWPTIRCCTN